MEPNPEETRTEGHCSDIVDHVSHRCSSFELSYDVLDDTECGAKAVGEDLLRGGRAVLQREAVNEDLNVFEE